MNDLRKFETRKPAKQVLHPLYDNFGTPVEKEKAREVLQIDQQSFVLLFFGFIRKYKGLDLVLEALSILKKLLEQTAARPGIGVKLLIAGEFYEDDQPYLDQIERLGIGDSLILKTNFIPDNEVKYYFGAVDLVVQPYRSATQSGVTPLSYHFEKPMVVTNVGGLPDLVPHERVGLVAEPDPVSIAHAIRRYIELGENYFLPHLRSEKQKYSWTALTKTVFELAAMG